MKSKDRETNRRRKNLQRKNYFSEGLDVGKSLKRGGYFLRNYILVVAISFLIYCIFLGGVGEAGNQGQNDADADWMDEINDEDDSAGEDSDDEGLNSKLCTFTQTQKEFMNQHWYHCHTCKMVDGVGVCTVCAKVMNSSRFNPNWHKAWHFPPTVNHFDLM